MKVACGFRVRYSRYALYWTYSVCAAHTQGTFQCQSRCEYLPIPHCNYVVLVPSSRVQQKDGWAKVTCRIQAPHTVFTPLPFPDQMLGLFSIQSELSTVSNLDAE